MMVMKKTIVTFLMVMLCSLSAFAQVDRREVRAGNRAFKKGEFGQSEVDYKKALLKDSTSVAAQYNLANALYKLENYTEAEKYSKAALDSLSRSPRAADAHYNNGDIYLQQRRWSEAIEAFKSSLRLNPDDMDAKSNLAYAQKMLQNEQQQQNQDGDGENNQQNDQNQDQNNDQNQNQDQNQDQNKDQDKQDDQNKDQNKDDQQQNPDQNQDQDQQPPKDQPQQDQKISPEAAEQMLQAIQAKEDETQEKVKKEKAAAVKSRQKEKNW